MAAICWVTIGWGWEGWLGKWVGMGREGGLSAVVLPARHSYRNWTCKATLV